MIVGVPKEIKDSESRVGITPAGVKALTEAGHTVLVETQAGAQSGFSDAEYQNAGAEIVGDAGYAWGQAEMVVKVKEPIESEYAYFREGLVLFTYLHLAPLPGLTDKLLESKVIGIAYETVRGRHGTLPLLMPMSEVAGRMSVQVGASCLEKERGGRGILLGGVPGVPPAHVAILGGGVVGTNAARIALGFGAKTTLIDREPSVTSARVERDRASTRRQPDRVYAEIQYRDDSGPQTYYITQNEVSVGRGGEDLWVDVPLYSSEEVSREHLRLRRDPASGGFAIVDQSRNGTWVNGRRLARGEEEKLPDRAEIGVAEVIKLTFQARR